MKAASQGLTTFVLAGGKGERLYPLTRERAKPAVPFGGIYRIIDFTLSNCVNSGIRRIHILTQYKSSSLDHHLRMGWNVFHAELNEYIDIIPPQQRVGEHWYRGTADAIYQNIRTMEWEACGQVLILAGDHVYKMDYTDMVHDHVRSGAAATVAVVEVPAEQSGQFGVVETDERNRITGFREKPVQAQARRKGKRPSTVLASMGIYVFDRQVLLEELRHDQERGGAHDFGKSILPDMVGRRDVAAYRFGAGPVHGAAREAYWRDVGTVDAYYRANMDLLTRESAGLDLYDEAWPIRTYQRQLRPTRLQCPEGARNEICDSLVANGCTLGGARIVRCVLSPGVKIHSGCQIHDTVLLEGVEVGRGARIRNAVVDKHVRIPPGSIVGHDPEEDRCRFGTTTSGVVVLSGDPFPEPGERAGRRPAQPTLPMFAETQQRVGI